MPSLFDYFVQRSRQQGGGNYGGYQPDDPLNPRPINPMLPQNERHMSPRSVDMGLVANKPEQTAVRDIPALLQGNPTDPQHESPGHVDLGANQQQQVLPSDLELERQKYDELSDRSTVKNNDKGWKGLIGDMLRQFIISGGETARAGGSTGQILGGGIGGAGYAAYDPAVDEKRKREYDIQMQGQKVGELEKRQQGEFDNQYKQSQIDNTRDSIQARRDYQTETTAWRKEETQRKIADRASREQTSRMNAVAGILKNIPAYDPTDPKFAELTKALGDVNLPLTPKDVKKNVKLVQDARDGQWTVILTDPLSGEQETRTVQGADGKPLKTTPTVIMQGELGLLRQDDQQAYQAGENAKTRAHQTRLAELRGNIQKEQIILRGKISAEQRAASTKKIADWMDEAENLN